MINKIIVVFLILLNLFSILAGARADDNISDDCVNSDNRFCNQGQIEEGRKSPDFEYQPTNRQEEEPSPEPSPGSPDALPTADPV